MPGGFSQEIDLFFSAKRASRPNSKPPGFGYSGATATTADDWMLVSVLKTPPVEFGDRSVAHFYSAMYRAYSELPSFSFSSSIPFPAQRFMMVRRRLACWGQCSLLVKIGRPDNITYMFLYFLLPLIVLTEQTRRRWCVSISSPLPDVVWGQSVKDYRMIKSPVLYGLFKHGGGVWGFEVPWYCRCCTHFLRVCSFRFRSTPLSPPLKLVVPGSVERR